MHFRCSGALVCAVGNQGSRYRLSAWSATKARSTSGRPTLVRGTVERWSGGLHAVACNDMAVRLVCWDVARGRGRLKGAWVSAGDGDGDGDGDRSKV